MTPKPLKYYNYDIVFQEVPDEVSLAINLTNCPNRCPECHSKHLWEDIGEPLTTSEVERLANQYQGLITCFCIMGGDANRNAVEELAHFIHTTLPVKVAWYSGRYEFPTNADDFNYVKLGPYDSSFGSLKEHNTNQHLYRREGGEWVDITNRFWKK